MKDNFARAQRILRQANATLPVQAVNGCCYGKDNHPDKGAYYKYCGQKFWDFISAEPMLYEEIIKPLGHNAKHKNQEFLENYAAVVNRFTLAFIESFCEDGVIQWEKLLRFNSAE